MTSRLSPTLMLAALAGAFALSTVDGTVRVTARAARSSTENAASGTSTGQRSRS